jgi:two-component system chemotaxis sensor kinase CheA
VNEFLEQFLIEGRELVEQTTEDVLALEEMPDDEARLDSAFRGFHTLKGGAGIVEFAAMARVLHAAEDSLAAIRAGDRLVSGEQVTDYLACLDQVLQWLDELEREGRLPAVPEATADALVARFQVSDFGDTAARSAEPPVGRPDWVEALLAEYPEHRGQDCVALRYRPDPDCFFRGDDPLALIERLPDLRAVRLIPKQPWPSLDALDPFACNLDVTALTDAAADQIRALFGRAAGQLEMQFLDQARSSGRDRALAPEALAVLRDQILLVADDAADGFIGRLGAAGRVSVNVLRHAGWTSEALALRQVADESLTLGQAAPLEAALRLLLQPPANAAAAGPAEPSLRRPYEMAVRALRVEVERIDALVKLTGELTVVKNAVGHAARLATQATAAGALAPLLAEQHVLLDRLVEQLQRSLLGIRVLPMRHVFRRYAKLVREMAADLGKSVRLVTEGEATEADTTVVEALSEPLLHVVRNAIDHGIEAAAQRAAAGKSPIATIRLRAAREGEQIVVEVADDGAGIDTGKVRVTAGARGIASPDALAAMTEDEIIALIFTPGLSTAAAVSEVSGRGVGMDVVRTTIERLGGRVEVASRAGEGTRVVLRVPFTVMISRVLTIEAGGQMFGVPMEHVAETVRLPRERIVQVGAAAAFVLREHTVPLLNLADALGFRDEAGEAPQANLVVTAIGGQLAALEVDRFGEHLDVMLKPMDGLLAGLRGIAGTTLLGDGRVLIVLDMLDLLQ